ncbi:hypothetical protein Y1Q_0005038 [Alligator mississippiensis]|uniref:Uncharacterized protein n=1 Tax=Alligator mississippiensis TaxID=8496 RepID=A0A151MYV1_ALLMI|nr:hypothetical protein Y1Q_0005038 [Alligator mississippiensis]
MTSSAVAQPMAATRILYSPFPAVRPITRSGAVRLHLTARLPGILGQDRQRIQGQSQHGTRQNLLSVPPSWLGPNMVLSCRVLRHRDQCKPEENQPPQPGELWVRIQQLEGTHWCWKNGCRKPGMICASLALALLTETSTPAVSGSLVLAGGSWSPLTTNPSRFSAPATMASQNWSPTKRIFMPCWRVQKRVPNS